jgi:hypothetical protein
MELSLGSFQLEGSLLIAWELLLSLGQSELSIGLSISNTLKTTKA